MTLNYLSKENSGMLIKLSIKVGCFKEISDKLLISKKVCNYSDNENTHKYLKLFLMNE